MTTKIKTLLIFSLIIATALLMGCETDSSTDPVITQASFTVTIENVSGEFDFFASGVFNEPISNLASPATPGPIQPGDSYEFNFAAAPGHKLSLATMFVLSNDLFYAPDGDGIELFDALDNPITGDITDQFHLWDAGTEVNEEPGVGMNQPPLQAGPNTGPDDPNNTVRLVNDAFTYPSVSEVIDVTLTYDGNYEFTLEIQNVSAGASIETPLAPGVFVIHTDANPLFTEGMPDYGDGLESLAEDGDPSGLGSYLDTESGLATPLAPGVWVVHTSDMPFFAEGQPDFDEGLEDLAEDGDPGVLSTSLIGQAGIVLKGVFNTPDGSSAPGVLEPGSTYSFTFDADAGDRLSLATMFVQSNDLFYGFGENGLALFNDQGPITGDKTGSIRLWDAGTEANQWPGVGPDQAPRQFGPNAGATDPDNTVRQVNDGYTYPANNEIIKITITTN
ncbi:MAG: spondin domain-containing protein [bacterium]